MCREQQRLEPRQSEPVHTQALHDWLGSGRECVPLRWPCEADPPQRFQREPDERWSRHDDDHKRHRRRRWHRVDRRRPGVRALPRHRPARRRGARGRRPGHGQRHQHLGHCPPGGVAGNPDRDRQLQPGRRRHSRGRRQRHRAGDRVRLPLGRRRRLAERHARRGPGRRVRPAALGHVSVPHLRIAHRHFHEPDRILAAERQVLHARLSGDPPTSAPGSSSPAPPTSSSPTATIRSSPR